MLADDWLVGSHWLRGSICSVPLSYQLYFRTSGKVLIQANAAPQLAFTVKQTKLQKTARHLARKVLPRVLCT